MAAVEHYQRNTKGRAFVIGDLHGCYNTLQALLEKLHFDKDTDVLYSVGDLVDRGPDSIQCLSLVKEPWFHAVRGNHEAFICQYFQDPDMGRTHLANGGEWFYDLSQEGKQAVRDLALTLPFSLDIQTDFGLIGLVHAGVWENWPDHCATWECHREISKTLTAKLYHRTLWSRTRLRNNDQSPVAGVHLVMVGHSPVPQPTLLGNTLYVDTGCGAGYLPRDWLDQGYQPYLTAVELVSPLVYHTQPRLDTLTVYR